MLTIHQAMDATRPRSSAKTGLAIAGGGPVGAIYELGALRALDESIDGLRLHELDVYVGVSAGALIASGLANGISSAELCRIFMGQEYASLKFEPENFLRPAFGEYFQRAAKLPAILTDTLINIIKEPIHTGVSQVVGELARAIPSGIFNNEAMHNFMEQTFAVTGHTNRFDGLNCKLYIVAVDLDSGAVVCFGDPSHQDVTISRAVQASAALPGLYPPVEIDGHYYVDGALRRTLHASVALDEGIDMLLGVNPLVPFDAGENARNADIPAQQLISGGLPLILSQTFRALIQSRMEAGFRKYLNSHPSTDLVLLEPDRGDEEIFFTNIFSYASRQALCEHAYQATRRDLLARRDAFDPVLKKRGMSLNMDLLKDPHRDLQQSIGAGRSSHAVLARNLSGILDDLEDLLDKRKAI